MPPPLDPEPAVLDIPRAAARLGVTAKTASELVRTGRLPARRYTARRVRVSVEAVDDYLARAARAFPQLPSAVAS